MATVVPRMKLGSQGLEVSAQGLGCMGMSFSYGLPKPEDDMISLIRHAISSGITFLDTSDMYGPHTNEILLGKVINSLSISICHQFQQFLIFCCALGIVLTGTWEVLSMFNMFDHTGPRKTKGFNTKLLGIGIC